MTGYVRGSIAATILFLFVPALAAAQSESLEITTIDRFSLILYAFDSDEPGPINTRILDEYVLPEIGQRSEIEIVGYSDVVGQERHNFELAGRRARKVASVITRGADGYASMRATAAGEEHAPYRYDLPEGRLLSRTVVITVKTKGEGRTWVERDEGGTSE